MNKSAHKPLTQNQRRIIQAELLAEQRQLDRERACPTLADLRDWLMSPEVPQHYEVAL